MVYAPQLRGVSKWAGSGPSASGAVMARAAASGCISLKIGASILSNDGIGCGS